MDQRQKLRLNVEVACWRPFSNLEWLAREAMIPSNSRSEDEVHATA